MPRETLSHYEILGILDEYRLGTVYRARDLRSGRLVAIQVIEPAEELRMPDTEKLQAFRAPLAAVIDAGQHERGVWIASELLEGGSLHLWLRSLQAEERSLAPDTVVECALQVAEGIDHLHKNGIRHGNLTSRCVMRAPDGRWKLTAFDVAGLTSGGTISDADIHRDILLIGEFIQELARAVPSGMPPEILPIVRRAVSPNPRDSYPSTDALLLDLQRMPAAQLTEAITAPPRRSDSRQFREGEMVAERFRIIRFVARGGMGEVYEAEDLELRERVALKTVRSEIAADPASIDRFRREIQLARRITHPNVCRIFDLFRHPESKVLFLTMELLNGQTLAHRILNSGPLQPDEALPIVEQLAAGLQAAHEAGVIHRDFKSANVILAGADTGGRLRAVITDFGLARPVAPVGDLTMSLAGAGLAGTPAYMAPEQVRGEELTPASDVYALGIVMYEMMTGALPFAESTPLATAAKRLNESPPSPRVRRPELSEMWEAAILECLEREPERRFQNAAGVVAALTGKAARTKPPAPPVAIPRRWLAAAGAATVVAAIAGTYSLRVAKPGKSRVSVAVLGFRNLAGASDAAWLSTAFSEMLTTELSAGEKLRTVSGENVARMKADLDLREIESSLARDTLARIRSYIGTDVLAFGSYVVVPAKSGRRVRLDLRLQDARTGDMLASFTEEASVDELLGLVARAGASLRRELGAAPLSSVEVAGLRASLPSNQEAARLYTDGLERLRRFDAPEARRLLESAVEADPEFALARSALATAWSMSGYAQKAKAEAETALRLSQRLQREDRLLVEARFHEAAGQWEQAAESYRTLFGFFPDNLEYGLRLAGSRISAGKPQEALATLTDLRKLPPPDRDNPRIDMADSRAAGALGAYKQQRTAAAAAITKAEARGAKLMAAGARLLEGIALQNLGELRQAVGAFERARSDYLAAGDRWGAANAANNLAVARAKTGDLAEARRGHEESLALYRQLGDRAGEAAALSSLANLLRTRGQLAEARALHAEALRIYRDTGNRTEEARTLNNLANTLASAGESAEAKAMYEAALPIFREIGDESAAGTILTNLAGIRLDGGDIAGAAELYEQARGIFERTGAQSSLAFVLHRLGDLHLGKGDSTAGREHHQKALAIRQRLGEKGGVAESQLALALIALDQDVPASAETLAREALQEFRNQKRMDDEAMAQSVLARALLGQGRAAEAWAAARSALAQADATGNQATRIAIRTTAASIQAVLGNTRAATDSLNTVIAEARRNALSALEMEARLALGQIEIAGGNESTGRARLAALEKEASEKGYSRIAQRAAQRLK